MRAWYWVVAPRRRYAGSTWIHVAGEAALAAGLLLMGLGVSRFAGAPLPVIGLAHDVAAGVAAVESHTLRAAGAASSATSTSAAAVAVDVEIISGPASRAVLVHSGRQAVLLDGGSAAVGRAVVQRLHALGIPDLSVAVLSDPAASESLGLVSVLDAVPVGRILDLAPGSTCAAHATVLAVARAHQVPVQPAQRGATVAVGPAQLQVLWPAGDLAAPGELPQNPGLVRLVDGSVHVLFAAAIDPGELASIQRLGADLGAQVLEMPESGGAGWTPDLLRLVAPRVAIVEPPLAGSSDTALLQSLAAAHVVAVEATAQSDVQLQTDGHGLVLSLDPGLPGVPAETSVPSHQPAAEACS